MRAGDERMCLGEQWVYKDFEFCEGDLVRVTEARADVFRRKAEIGDMGVVIRINPPFAQIFLSRNGSRPALNLNVYSLEMIQECP